MFYNLPAPLLDSFKNDPVIIRSGDPSELVEAVSRVHPNDLLYLQLLSLDQDTEILMRVKAPVRLDLTLRSVGEFPLLYRYAAAGRFHAIRVTVPVSPGCAKAVRLATSLGFPVKLQVNRLDNDLVAELSEILQYYLHNTTVGVPIEFFHSLLAAFYLRDPRTLWDIQEENPAHSRYVSDEGEIFLSERLPIAGITAGGSYFLDGNRWGMLPGRGECGSCPYFANCQGYFKVPDDDFDCLEVKRLLQMIGDAAAELRDSLEEIPHEEGR